MSSKETGCLGVAAALALSALAGDAAAEVAASHAPGSPAARPRTAQVTQPKARPRATSAKKTTPAKSRPQLSRSLDAPALAGIDAALSPLILPVPVVPPLASAPRAAMLPGAELPDAGIREKHLREAPEVPATGPRPVRAKDEATPEATTGDEQAIEVAERLLGDGVPLQLLQSVIVPAARGVTIAEIQTEGSAAVTLSVRPTKITRGSGLVAVGRF